MRPCFGQASASPSPSLSKGGEEVTRQAAGVGLR